MALERQTFSMRARWGKWAGLYLGLIAAFGDQQIVTNAVYARCPEQAQGFTLIVGGVCAALALAGAAISWFTRQSLPAISTTSAALRTDRFIATLSAGFAVLALLLVLFGTTAGLILRCERF
jgi:hypothetical protein